MVAYLGASEHLVGITHACDFPEVVCGRPQVTRAASGDAPPFFTLDDARLHQLHPDVILTQALCDVCAVSETDVRTVAATIHPPPRIVTLGGSTIEGIFADVRAVADALGVPDEADELLAGERARLRQVHDTLKTHRAPRPRMLVLEWLDPVYVAGHWAPEQVHRAGGRNLLSEVGQHSEVVRLEACAAAQPDIVIVAPCGLGLAEAEAEARALLTRPEWQWLAERQLWAMDGNSLVSRPGPRVVDGVETLARIGHPTLFSALDPHHAVRVA